MRRQEIRFGSFERLLGTPVHARDWWFCRAEGVKLQGEVPRWYDLNEYRTLVEERVRKPAPHQIDANWVRERLPVGLGLSLNLDVTLTPIDLDLVALDADADVEVTYPFLLREREYRVLFGFSPDGPPREIRDSIIVGLGARLLWVAGRGGFL